LLVIIAVRKDARRVVTSYPANKKMRESYLVWKEEKG
jgi:hypothetical protein